MDTYLKKSSIIKAGKTDITTKLYWNLQATGVIIPSNK